MERCGGRLRRDLKIVTFDADNRPFIRDSQCTDHECYRPPSHITLGVGHLCACDAVFWHADASLDAR